MKHPAQPNLYPDSEFLRDYQKWHHAVNHPLSPWKGQGEKACLDILSLQYQHEHEQFRYRMNRFACIMNSIHGDLPQLIQDRIAFSDGGEGGHVPEHLLLAMLAWYRTVPEKKMKTMPTPNWPKVLREYDRLDRQFPE